MFHSTIRKLRTARELRLGVVVWLLSLSVAGMPLPQTAQPLEHRPDVAPGVVIKKFQDQYAATKKAGMQEGDVLLRWSRGDAYGELQSPFDLSLVVYEELVRGPIRFEGLRGTERRIWTVTNQWWGTETRPNFSRGALTEYLAAEALFQKGKFDKAVEQWRRAAAVAHGQQPPWLESWILFDAAEHMARGQQWKEADDLYEEALLHTEPLGHGIRGQLLTGWAEAYFRRSSWDEAEKYLLLAWAENRKAGQENLVADDLADLALLERERGDLTRAGEHERQALEIRERLEPGNIRVAELLINTGITSYYRGDLARAEQCYRNALEIFQTLIRNSVGEAYALDDLAELELTRGNLETAEADYRKSQEILEERDPGSLGLATIFSDRAKALVQRGDSREAEQLLRRSLDIKLKAAPGSMEEAETRQGLGDLARLRGDLAGAEQIYRKALALRTRLSPEGIPTSETLSSLGDVASLLGDLDKAESYYRRALAIREKYAPGSTYHAESLADLGAIMRRRNQIDAAEQYYAAALNALESQTARLGGSSDARTGFRAKHNSYYREYADLLLLQHKAGPALAVLERSRARTLLEMLAAAHVDVRHGADPSLLKRERELRADINAKSERRIQLLSDKHSDEQVKAVEKEISDLTAQYQEVEAQLRSASPNYAALTQPQPLTAKEIQQQLLDRDTLLLEYSLGKERSHVFAVTPDSLEVFGLPARAQMERQARRVYRLLTARNRNVRGETLAQRERRWRRDDAAYQREAHALSRMVLGPVAARMQNKRLLIVADGALNYIPFAALPEPNPTEKASLPLAVNHEIVSLPSASVLALLRQQYKDRKPAPQAVAVLADPVFDKNDPRVSEGVKTSAQTAADRGATPQSGEDDSLSQSLSAGLLTRSAADLGLKRDGQLMLSRLRYTREEADAIRAVTPPTKVLEAVDFRASRATATSPELANYRIVHFATHGLLNSKHPELSGLVLSLVDKKGKPQDGFLTLQDIYNMNLSADLVVLSACETGLGKEISGEGLIGMTRGFMYAGASRVVASLWNVSDVATARLMAEFYRGMEEDKLSPAAALRAAQVKMWKQPRWRSPYYWAAFQIQGEWR